MKPCIMLIGRLLLLRPRRWLPGWLSFCLWLACLLGLWHLTPASPRAAFRGGKEACLHAFSPDSNTLVTSAGGTRSWDCPGPIHLWDVPSGRERATVASDWRRISDCQFSPDGRLFAAMNEGNHLKLWETATGKERGDLPLQTGLGYNLEARFSPDGRFIIYEHCDPVHPYGPRSFHFWEIATQQERAAIGGDYGELEIAADGKTLNYTHWEGPEHGYTIEHWRFVEGPQVVARTGTVSIPGGIFPRFSPNLERCVTFNLLPGPVRADEIKLWDTATGKEMGSVILSDENRHPHRLWFLPGGRLLTGLTCGETRFDPGYRFTVWDPNGSLNEIATCKDHSVVSENGRWLLTCVPAGADVVDTVSGDIHGELRNSRDEPYSGLRSVCGQVVVGGPPDTQGVFGPDGSTAVITGLGHNRKEGPITPFFAKLGLADPYDNYPQVARLWDLEHCRELASFDGCERALYSPDGKILATAHTDGTIRLWDVPPRKPILAVAAQSLALCFALLLGVRLARRLVRRNGKGKANREVG